MEDIQSRLYQKLSQLIPSFPTFNGSLNLSAPVHRMVYTLSHLHMSPGFLALSYDAQTDVMLAIQSYDFKDRPDLSGERRFGTVEAPDPADGRKTRRLLAIWTSEERNYDPELHLFPDQ